MLIGANWCASLRGSAANFFASRGVGVCSWRGCECEWQHGYRSDCVRCSGAAAVVKRLGAQSGAEALPNLSTLKIYTATALSGGSWSQVLTVKVSHLRTAILSCKEIEIFGCEDMCANPL